MATRTLSEQPTIQLNRNEPGVLEHPASHTVPHDQSQLVLEVGTGIDPGITRKHQPNEDCLFAFQCVRAYQSQFLPFGLFVIADGLGGHASGQKASSLGIRVITSSVVPSLLENSELDTRTLPRLLADGVQQANQAIYQRNQQVKANMGTTITAVLIAGCTAYVTNVGDSRTYLYREPHGLHQVTRDHSIVARLAETGVIKPDDIYTHPKRNQIYRSLGDKTSVEIDTFAVPLQVGDKLLLCSDGLWEMVHDPDIQRILSTPAMSPSQIVQSLIQAALAGGGKDNVSAIVIFVS